MDQPVRRLVDLSIVVLVVVTVLELAALALLHRQTAAYAVGDLFPVPSGYSLEHHYLPAVALPCYLMRVTADACPDCRMDQQQYSRVVGEARKAGCGLYSLAPRVGQARPRPDDPTTQLQYVELSLGRALTSLVTPQTLLLDRRGLLQWQHQGALRDTDVAAAMRALGELR